MVFFVAKPEKRIEKAEQKTNNSNINKTRKLTVLRASWAESRNDNITPMMVILTKIFSGPAK